MQDFVVATIPKNGREEIRVVLTTYKGHDLVDLRVFVEAEGKAERIPTRKGITFKRELLAQVADAMVEAYGAAQTLRYTAGNT
jgi:hypothetical protein